jgi:hypothetical protein
VSTVALQQSERQFERAVVEYAKLAGWRVFHPFDSRRSEAGWPDLTLVRDGRLVFAELKSEKGRVRPEQQVWQEALLRVASRTPGVEVYLWRPSMWDEIEGTLR